MLLEGMVRLGRALEQGDLPAEELLVQLGDGLVAAAAHYGRAWLVEARPAGPGRWHTAVLPSAEWAIEDPDGRHWHPIRQQVAAAPVVLAVGGNRQQAQGRYAVPAYPIWPPQQEEMAARPDAVMGFLRPRLERTYGWDPAGFAGLEEAIAGGLSQAMTGVEAVKGLVVLLVEGLSPAYVLTQPGAIPPEDRVRLAPSRLEPGRTWTADLEAVLQQFWWAKWGEGQEYGFREDGECSLCGRRGPVVSFYAKAWPWFSLRWEAPLPQELPHNRLDEGVGLCEACYRDLTLGGNAFQALKRPMPPRLSAEVFDAAPVHDRRSRRNRAPQILGVAYVLPLLDNTWGDPERGAEVARALQRLGEREGKGAGRHLSDILGLEDAFLPEDLADDAFRLYLVYFSEQQADAQFHALMEDVLPSVVGRLQDEVLPTVQALAETLQVRSGPPSLLWLLAKAYGPRYLWQSLERALRAGDLEAGAMVARAAQELAAAARLLTVDGHAGPLRQRAREYQLTRQFLHAYRAAFGAGQAGEDGLTMIRNWQALQALADGDPGQEPATDPEELGFVAGHLVARFGRQYFARTGKDYLKTRVLPFGSSLTPTLVHDRAMGRIQEVAEKLDIHLVRVLVHQTGKWLNEYRRMQDDVIRRKEAFLAGFWSGYALYDLAPSATKESGSQAVPPDDVEQEEA
ncbi:conserved protein of unknown function [Candidatus Hydrogenisulfobacillus filiaventi]|uniref:Uncharacterized protein n=1 Tax=Candidatus Hydrogenisulfobacillus filiaventi TaxID=2707344 RepID=A0A6F8ZCV3_9FIRM|nr:hypothetical protein [Bacillota bacterium]CAB1127575.1 conserved protein of unknown function [Candidatus Hydrogenisulfobacillus filiaventi]